MTVQRGFAFDHGKAVQGNAPSSCDGASCESAFDPNTGARVPGYVAPQPPARLSTAGALGDESAHGDIVQWKANAHRPGLGEQPSGDGTGYAIGD
jgi:hypothetical protein